MQQRLPASIVIRLRSASRHVREYASRFGLAEVFDYELFSLEQLAREAIARECMESARQTFAYEQHLKDQIDRQALKLERRKVPAVADSHQG
jgi:hypothetical protein